MTENINQEAVGINLEEFPNCVRLRKGMYISNLNQMVTEIIDNSVDEHTAGFCNNIAVVINPTDNSILVQDDGRGIPVIPHPKNPNKTHVEVAMTSLHAGGKIGVNKGYNGKTGGLNGKNKCRCKISLIAGNSLELNLFFNNN